MVSSPGSATLPDLPFHSFRALDQEISEFYVLQERHAMDFEAPKLWKDRPGDSLSPHWSAKYL